VKILLAVDGSKYSIDAVDSVIRHADWYREKPEVELVTVHLPVPKLHNMHLVIGKNQIDEYYAEEGEAALVLAKKKLEAAGIKYRPSILVGQIAETLVDHAAKTACDVMVIGTHGHGATAGLLMGSVATKVVHIAKLPVLLVK